MMTAQELFQTCRVRLIASGNELRSLFLDDTAHRAELEDGERAAFVADAYLPEEHRAVALVRNEETDDEEDRRADDNACEGCHKVEASFDAALHLSHGIVSVVFYHFQFVSFSHFVIITPFPLFCCKDTVFYLFISQKYLSFLCSLYLCRGRTVT